MANHITSQQITHSLRTSVGKDFAGEGHLALALDKVHLIQDFHDGLKAGRVGIRVRCEGHQLLARVGLAVLQLLPDNFGSLEDGRSFPALFVGGQALKELFVPLFQHLGGVLGDLFLRNLFDFQRKEPGGADIANLGTRPNLFDLVLGTEKLEAILDGVAPVVFVGLAPFRRDRGREDVEGDLLDVVLVVLDQYHQHCLPRR